MNAKPYGQPAGQDIDAQLEALVEQIRCEVNGDICPIHLHRLVDETAAAYRNATVTAYIPIFVRRKVLEQLRTPKTQREAARSEIIHA
ncbi:three-helix bundle dimerization domain-containing protein [Candidatus Entotheonella palauensis]|uniref:three-helix bundle dimerization domain-containing protein n=1 Tax=Candidatus Entotheonella palauensis TaxID=93172 RepID=UPI000B7FE5E1|nr:hypothetical protein [Candidatus Entotheonella palauensis]